MNDHSINWTGVLAIIALLEFFRNGAWAVIVSFMVKPARAATKKIDHLEAEITSLNLSNIRVCIDDHEERVRKLERDAVVDTEFKEYRDVAERDRRLVNKKLDILLQRTAQLRDPADERELSDEN
jgi:hypothetical protein